MTKEETAIELASLYQQMNECHEKLAALRGAVQVVTQQLQQFDKKEANGGHDKQGSSQKT